MVTILFVAIYKGVAEALCWRLVQNAILSSELVGDDSSSAS